MALVPGNFVKLSIEVCDNLGYDVFMYNNATALIRLTGVDLSVVG